ncbi:YqcI/YcgG family protein [Frankia sp. R82]|uniref:YqcI/YcgG family protein n=1 Tax=Frankia sp. R82 TaxID=2950553 RepID=UPI00204484B4|nr:YqcI/YcgG family protein [Frankia sp. R82]MCM3886206.1 YqcI/YcgG family protein [Frankia sp. R82]
MASSSDAYRESVQDLTLGPLPSWGTDCVRTMIDTLTSTDELFPCVFAVAAANRGGLRFGFVDDLDDSRTWSVLPDILATYLAVYQGISRNTSLVVFFGSGRDEARDGARDEAARVLDKARARDILAYEQRFWSLLQYLHDGDGEPWPLDVPTDTDDAGWEFSFRGSQLFVVCNTPAHQRLRSRSSPVFTITFQPRWVFEGLEPHTPRGAAARRTIRARLRTMDEVDSTPLLGAFGDPANREWKQYFLRDDATVADGCPFLASRRPAGVTRPVQVTARPAAVPTSVPLATSTAGVGVTAGAEPSARLFTVVVNAEQQYSVWPAGRANALGWFDTSVTGTREQCLDSIAATWSDLRPRSLRRRMAGAADATVRDTGTRAGAGAGGQPLLPMTTIERASVSAPSA